MQEALNHYDRAISLDKACSHCYAERAQVHTVARNIDGAITELTSVIQLVPYSFEAYYQRGLLRFSQSNWKGAKSDY